MINVNSETWLLVKNYLTEELREDSRQLESVNCSHDMANVLRGRIMTAKDLLDLPNAD